MIEYHEDDEKTRQYYKEMAFKIKELNETFSYEEWENDYGTYKDRVHYSRDLRNGTFHMVLVKTHLNGRKNDTFSVAIEWENELLFVYSFNNNHYSRNELYNDWEEYVNKFYENKDDLDEDIKEGKYSYYGSFLRKIDIGERQEKYGRDDLNIIRNMAHLLNAMYYNHGDDDINPLFYETRRMLNQKGIEVKSESHRGNVYEFLNRYEPNDGGFSTYCVSYNHELVAYIFSDFSYDYSKEITFKPGPWLQDIEKIYNIQAEKFNYKPIIYRK